MDPRLLIPKGSRWVGSSFKETGNDEKCRFNNPTGAVISMAPSTEGWMFRSCSSAGTVKHRNTHDKRSAALVTRAASTEGNTLEGFVEVKYKRRHRIGKFRRRYAVLDLQKGSLSFYSLDAQSEEAQLGAGDASARRLVLFLRPGSWAIRRVPRNDTLLEVLFSSFTNTMGQAFVGPLAGRSVGTNSKRRLWAMRRGLLRCGKDSEVSKDSWLEAASNFHGALIGDATVYDDVDVTPTDVALWVSPWGVKRVRRLGGRLQCRRRNMKEVSVLSNEIDSNELDEDDGNDEMDSSITAVDPSNGFPREESALDVNMAEERIDGDERPSGEHNSLPLLATMVETLAGDADDGVDESSIRGCDINVESERDEYQSSTALRARLNSEPVSMPSSPAVVSAASSGSEGNDSVSSFHSAPQDLRLSRHGLSGEWKVKVGKPYGQKAMTEDELVADTLKASEQFENFIPDDNKRSCQHGKFVPIGSLRVEVLSCIGLPKFDRFSRNDTKVYLLCGDSAFSTDVVASSLSPLWPRSSRRAASFPLYHAYARLYIGVFGINSSEKENDYYAGRAVVDLSSLRPRCEYDVTLPLRLSTYAYDNRRRGVVRLRFVLKWTNERAAVLSYLRKPSGQSGKDLSISCADAKTFRNVAMTLYGIDLPGKFSHRAFRATRREFILYHIQTRALLKRVARNVIMWRNPFVSAYLFFAWMHSVFSSSIALALPYFFGFLSIIFMQNYVLFVQSEAMHGGYSSLTFEELLLSLLFGGEKSRNHYMNPISVRRKSEKRRSISEGTGLASRNFTDASQLDHMEFPFSERNVYPKRSVKDCLVRSSTTEKASQVRMMSFRNRAQMQRSIFPSEHESENLTDNEEDLGESDFESELDDTNEDTNDEESLGIVESHGPIPLGPNQDADFIPKKRVPPKVHLRKFENVIHGISLGMFDDKVTHPSAHRARQRWGKSRQNEGQRQLQEANVHSKPESKLVLHAADQANQETLLPAIGYVSQLIGMTPFLVYDAVKPWLLNTPLRIVENWVVNPTVQRQDGLVLQSTAHEIPCAKGVTTTDMRTSASCTSLSERASPENIPSSRKRRRTVDDFERRLGVRPNRQNPVSALSADYLGPIMRIMQIWCGVVRIVFNVGAWKDPFLSFWVLSFLIALTIITVVFPWRNFFFVVGLIGLGPQNWLYTLTRSKMNDGAAADASEMIFRTNSAKQLEVCRAGIGSDPPNSEGERAGSPGSNFTKRTKKFPRILPSKQQLKESENLIKAQSQEDIQARAPFSSQPEKIVQKMNRRNVAPREVFVPYTPLRKERFYYWPPDPTASRVTTDSRDYMESNER